MKTFNAAQLDGNPKDIKSAFVAWAWDNRVFSDDTIKVIYGNDAEEFMVITEEQYLLELAEAIREENSNDIILSQTPLQKAMDLVRSMSTEDLFEIQKYVDGYIEHMISQMESQMDM